MKKCLLLFISAFVFFSVLVVCACQDRRQSDDSTSSDGQTSSSESYASEGEQSDSSRTDYYGPNV